MPMNGFLAIKDTIAVFIKTLKRELPTTEDEFERLSLSYLILTKID